MIVKKIRNQKTGSTKAARVAGVANYIVGPQHDHSVEKCIHHEANNFLTDTHEGHVAEMIALAQDAVRSKDPIDHWVLSWAPNERPSVDQVREAVGLFLGHCGLSGHQVIWGLHDDTEHLHVHIAVNRVHPETLKVVEINKGFQLNAAHQAIAIIEKKQGWKSTQNARYRTNDKAELVADRTTQLPKVNKDKSKPLEPTGFARDRKFRPAKSQRNALGLSKRLRSLRMRPAGNSCMRPWLPLALNTDAMALAPNCSLERQPSKRAMSLTAETILAPCKNALDFTNPPTNPSLNMTPTDDKLSLITQSSTPMSRTLNRLDLTPLTLCAFCPAAIWMSPIPIAKGKPKLKIFCSLMRVLITEELLECDGEAIATAQKEAREAQ
ncbi:MobA [Polaromonas sp. CG9_12]|nr:MobA [Polaromonas sp. CG9_12]